MEGFYRLDGECAGCPDNPWLIWVIIGAVLIVAGIAGYILNSKHVHLALLSIGMDYFQVLAIFARSNVRTDRPVLHTDGFIASPPPRYGMSHINKPAVMTKLLTALLACAPLLTGTHSMSIQVDWPSSIRTLLRWLTAFLFDFDITGKWQIRPLICLQPTMHLLPLLTLLCIVLASHVVLSVCAYTLSP